MRAPITLSLHIPHFDYPGIGAGRVFEQVVEIATAAERSGFSSISVMDHLHQIEAVGPEESSMLEGNTLLAALAARTSTLTLGLIVGGVTYHNPAHHAKIATTIDVISGGRAWLGVGAAWNEAEHTAYGFEFPSLARRFEMLEEAVQIARAMFTQEGRVVFSGVHFSVRGAYNNPKPIRGDIPIVIGGSGERKTLRLVAQHADGCNVFGDLEQTRHLMDVLERHCDTVGRDPDEITKTRSGVVIVAPTHEAAEAKLHAFKAAGLSEEQLSMVMAGDPDGVAEQADAYREAGIEGFTISIPDLHDLETVQLTGRALSQVFTSAH